MSTTNSAGPFVAQTLEDAVKAGVGGAGLGAVGATALTHSPLTVALGFVASFVVSIILSLLSQPIGDKSTNHVLSVAETVGQELLGAIVADIATQRPPVAPVTPAQPETVPAPTAFVNVPQAGVQGVPGVQPGVPVQ